MPRERKTILIHGGLSASQSLRIFHRPDCPAVSWTVVVLCRFFLGQPAGAENLVTLVSHLTLAAKAPGDWRSSRRWRADFDCIGHMRRRFELHSGIEQDRSFASGILLSNPNIQPIYAYFETPVRA